MERHDEGLASLADDGCQCNTASTPLNSPSRTIYTFALPPSSAGVPYSLMVPAFLFLISHSLSVIAAADVAVPKRLWPQACRETNVVRTQTIQTSFHFSTEQDSTHVKILIHKYGGATFASPSSLLRQKKWAHI